MLDNLKGYEIVLVSQSPRRRDLLASLGLHFTVGHSTIKEEHPAGMGSSETAMYLSRQKALHAEPKMKADNLVIAADTLVWLGDAELGKPRSEEEAAEMLGRLSGHNHDVVTGVTLLTSSTEKTFYAKTEVTFGTLTPEEIAYYVKTYHPLDKAGAYGIQEWIGMAGVKEINGSFYNVMGLPLHKLYTELKNIPSCC